MAHSGTIIYMRNVPGKPEMRALTQTLPCKNMDGSDGEVPVDFEWDGNSSSIFKPIFPQHDHPIASCRHDWRCLNAKTPEERKWADREFREDVGTTGWWITKQIGYAGVRAGAYLGVGCRYKGPIGNAWQWLKDHATIGGVRG